MGRDYSRDPDASPFDLPKWWQAIGESQKPSPYESASWAFFQTTVVEDNACEETPEGTFDCDPEDAWWETLGGTLRPYASASWAYFQESDLVLESFVWTEFFTLDDLLFQDSGDKDLIVDDGFFNASSPAAEVYDEAEWGSAGERVIMVKRTFAEVSVYDTYASYPGRIAEIAESLGDIATDPSAQDFIRTDGLSEDFFIEAQRSGEPGDDRPPGSLLAKVSYEIFGTVAKITSWSHYNWEDDEPVRKACEVLIRELPDCITEVTVEDDPTAFWVSLGFKQVVKGEPLLHLYR